MKEAVSRGRSVYRELEPLGAGTAKPDRYFHQPSSLPPSGGPVVASAELVQHARSLPASQAAALSEFTIAMAQLFAYLLILPDDDFRREAENIKHGRFGVPAGADSPSAENGV